jgi:hypothetical protein
MKTAWNELDAALNHDGLRCDRRKKKSEADR